MNVLSQRIGLMVAATAATMGLGLVAAPAASAETVTAAVTVAAPRPAWWCKPAHTGSNWRWDDDRRGGHWEKREWNRRLNRFVWVDQWRDNRYCAPQRNDRPWDRGDNRGGGPRNNR